MADDEIKPQGDYIFEDIPATQERAVARAAEARVRMTTKAVVQNYIDQYLGQHGKYRTQLEMSAPFVVSYFTNLSGRAQDDDPTIYNVQLARIWKGLRQKLPAIIIADTGFRAMPSGLGGLSGGFRLGGFESVQQSVMTGPVSLEILTAAMDETTASDLADILAYIFGPLTAFNHAWELSTGNPEDAWVVRLPQGGIESAAGMDRRNLTEDPVDSFWSSTGQLTVEFDGIVSNRILNDANVDQIETILRGPPESSGVTIPPDGKPIADSALVNYTVASEIVLGSAVPIEVFGLPWFARFISDNDRIAVVDERNFVQPRRPGVFNLLLVDFRPGLGEHGKVLRSDKVRVVLDR
jgi:hypothetical protein